MATTLLSRPADTTPRASTSSHARSGEYRPLDPTIAQTRINNRRYLGNKYRLLDFIRTVVDEALPSATSFADLFSGTGAVASAFTDKSLVTNDILYSNFICHVAWFSPEKVDGRKIERLIAYYNAAKTNRDNYVSRNFADTFFDLDVCRKIGFVRADIERRFQAGELNDREYAALLTSLLYALDRVAHTVGHYDAYLKGTRARGELLLAMPLVRNDNNRKNVCFNEDANVLAGGLSADVVYLDPPYNSRQYSDAYHLLENIATWDKPEVFGVARKMDRTHLKSDYCTTKAADAFTELISTLDTKLIVVSYNNTAEKGNARSNAKLSDADIREALATRGRVSVHSQAHKAFTTGRSDIADNEERLFVCRVTR